MSYMFQVADPEGLVCTVQVPGKYNPDILDDIRRRVVELYKEVLETRLAAVIGVDGRSMDDSEEEEPVDD